MEHAIQPWSFFLRFNIALEIDIAEANNDVTNTLHDRITTMQYFVPAKSHDTSQPWSERPPEAHDVCATPGIFLDAIQSNGKRMS